MASCLPGSAEENTFPDSVTCALTDTPALSLNLLHSGSEGRDKSLEIESSRLCSEDEMHQHHKKR